jgi:hypothetical protein
MYILGVPNTEVRVGLLKNLIPLYSNMDADSVYNTAKLISSALIRGDYDTALRRLQSFLAAYLSCRATWKCWRMSRGAALRRSIPYGWP